MGKPTYRSATQEDLSGIQEIARRTIDSCYRSFLGDEGVDWFLNSGESDRELERNLADLHLMTRDGAVVAFAIFFGDRIHLMMVDVSRHREGLGGQLLAFAETELFSTQETIRLNTFEGNAQAIAFYLKNGWTETHRERDPEHGFVRVFFEKQRSL